MSLSALSEAIRFLEEDAARGDQAGQGLELRADGDRLLWRNAPLPAAHLQVAWLREAMHQRLIATIGFRAPIHLEEVARLLVVLAEEPKALVSAGGAMRVFSLTERPSNSVRVEDVDFARELRESEDAWLDYCEEIEPDAAQPLSEVVQYCLGMQKWGRVRALHAPIGRLPVGVDASYGEDRPPRELLAEAVARLIQQAGEKAVFEDEEDRRAWQLDMLHRLSALGPEWRAHVFRSSSGPSSGQPDMLALIAREMPPEDCVSLVFDYSGAINRERSGGLRLLLSRIMSDPERATAIEPLLRAAAIRAGIDEQVYRNVVGMLMLELSLSPDSPQASGAPGAASASAGEASAEEDLSDLLATTDATSVHRSRVHMLTEIVELDLPITQYVALLRLLVDAAEQSAGHGDAVSLREGLSTLRRLSEVAEGSRQTMAASSLSGAGTPGVIAALFASAEESPAEEQAETLELLGVLGDAGVEALCVLVLRATAEVAEPALQVVMRRDAPRFRHLRGLLMHGSGEAIELIMGAALANEDRGPFAQFQVMLGHPDAGTRLKTVNLAREHDREQVVGLLIGFARDADAEVRRAAIEALGERRAAAAVPALCAVVRRGAASGPPTRAREAAVLALGRIGTPAALPTLSEVLSSGGLLDHFRSASLRVAAARAVAEIGTAEARQVLEKGMRDGQRSVREACRRALLTLAAAEQSRDREAAGVQ